MYLRAKYISNKIVSRMIIDTILAILAILAIVVGLRKGFVVQLLQLAGLYIAILIAPNFAGDIGSLITDDPGFAYLAGYGAIILGALIFLWIIAPLVRKLLFFEVLLKLDSVLGMALSLVTMIVVTSALCSLLVTANIGDMRPEKVLELSAQNLSSEEIDEFSTMLQNRDVAVREYFEPKYISYDILDESVLFNPLVELGDTICPGLEELEREAMKLALTIKSDYVSSY